MVCLKLISIEQVKSDRPRWKKEMEDFEHQVRCYFEEKIGAAGLAAAHRVILESLNELIKNAIDAGAENFFIEDRSTTLASSICIFDDGIGFSSDFLGADCASIDYERKLSGCHSIMSHKIGQNKLGGQGRGLAQAFDVIKSFDGKVICSHRPDEMKGAFITFSSLNTPVSMEHISELFNAARASWASPYCQYAQEDAESIVSQMKDSFRLFTRKSSKDHGLSLSKSNDSSVPTEADVRPIFAPN